MRRITRILALLVAVVAGAQAAQASKRLALVIGNSAYQHTAPLTNPKNDAKDIGAALKKHGFQVIEGFDLGKVAFDRKVREFAEAAPGATVALFFFAGHGLQVGGQNYLVPIDANLSTAAALDFEMVRLDLVHRSMERDAATSILVIDACRNNPLAHNLARAMGTRSAEIGRGLAQVEAGVGTLVSFSTQPGNVALDGTGRNSPFAGSLVKHITDPGDDLSAILIAVRNDVLKETKGQQVPWEHSALTGRFYFGAQRPQPKLPAEDEAAWGWIKDANEPAVFRRFVDQFPASARRPEAERRLAALAVKPASAPIEPPNKPTNKPQAVSKTASSTPEPGRPTAFVPTVVGAPGDGSAALTAAIKRELAGKGVAVAERPAATAYRVEGAVTMGPPREGKQGIQIEWVVKNPQGKRLGTVSQKNDIPEGSLDGAWGKTADQAVGAAVQGIIKLLP